MRPFSYVAPGSIEDAIDVMSSRDKSWRPIAGGQSLLLELKDRTSTPAALMSLRSLEELKAIRGTPAGLDIGAMVTYRQLVESTDLNGYASLASVACDIADIPVRTMATVGGAVCQADPRFDMPVVLQVLDARVQLRSESGERSLAVSDFIVGPRSTALKPGELLVRVHVPKPDPNFLWAFKKFRTREMDAALVSVVVGGTLSADAGLDDPVVIVGGCVSRPRRLTAVEQVLDGRPVTETLLGEVTEVMRASLEPDVQTIYFDADYKRHLAGVLLRRSLGEILERKPEGK